MKKFIFVFVFLIILGEINLAQCNWSPPFHVREVFQNEPRGAGVNYDQYTRTWYITIDYSFQYGNPAFLIFARAHEYAHIYAGHVDIYKDHPGEALVWSREMELEADEIAATWLIAAGCGWVVEYQMLNFANIPIEAPPHYPPNQVRARQLQAILYNPHIYSPVLMPSIGIYCGIGLSSLSGIEFSNPWGVTGTSGKRLSFDIGINWNYLRFGKNVALSTGMYYVNYGVNFSHGMQKASLIIEELYFPLVLNVGFRLSENVNWEMYAGGYFSGSFLLGVMAEISYGSSSSGDTVDNFSENDAGLLFGTNFVIKTTEGLSFLFGVKYQHGLSNFDIFDFNNMNRISTRYMGLSVGIRYDLGY